MSYLLESRPQPDALLLEMEEHGRRDGIPIVMPPTGALLGVLAAACGARRVVEVGTAIGVSTLYIARAMAPDGLIVSFEVDPVRQRAARAYLDRAGVGERADLRLRDAGDGLAELDRDAWDMVFLDGLKGDYPAHLELALPLLRSGGLVVVDNTLLSGLVAEGRGERRLDAGGDRHHAPLQRLPAGALGHGGGAAAGRRWRAGRACAGEEAGRRRCSLVVALARPARRTHSPAARTWRCSSTASTRWSTWPTCRGRRSCSTPRRTRAEIRVIVRHKLLPRPCVTLDVVSDGERGALGLVLDPDYRPNHYLYVYFTKRSPLENRVTRFTVKSNRCTHAASPDHRDPDQWPATTTAGSCSSWANKLFVTVGENHDPGNAQNLHTRLGKVLRYNRDGSIPRTNPMLGGRRSAIWSYGHRNGFGLTAKPNTNLLYETENGPNCDDELNHIMKGRNYGWGNGYVCGTNGVGPRPVAPLKRWTPTIAPTDPWWYRGRIKRMRGSIYMGDFNTGTLRRITLNRAGTAVKSISLTYHAPSGIIDVSSGPGRWLYFATQTAIYRIVS